jgi:hypothetical protein
MGPRLSHEASRLLTFMGQGHILRMPHGQSAGSAVQSDVDANGKLYWRPIGPPIQTAIVDELAAQGIITKLTELGEPPAGSEERARAGGWRNGWRELGLDGETADCWVCMQ